MERDGALARWSITDSGIGIPKAAQARLFEKFYRADNVTAIETEGTGLGLYLVRLIMEQLGGRVWCASEEGRAPVSWSPCRSRRSGAMQTTTGPIVLVEDDPFIRRACEVALRRRGFAVETAADGEAALDAVRGASPALVLLDLLLPKMTGLEVLRALRTDEATRGVRVLVLSNSSNERDAREITNLGVAGYLVKANLSLQELGDHVARLVEVER